MMEEHASKRTAPEDDDGKQELKGFSRKRWLGIVFVIAGIYFSATGLAGAVIPLKENGGNSDPMIIFTGIVGILGIVIIVIGGILFLKNNKND